MKQPNHQTTRPFIAQLLIACALLAGTAAQAHDIVLVPQAGGLNIRYGHPKDWLPVDHEKLIELQAIPAAGPTVDRHDALVRRGLDLQLKPASATGATLFAARYDNGLWVQRPAADGAPAAWRNTGRMLLPDAQGVMLSLKFAKAWAGQATDGQQYRQTVGHLLELVPQKNPRALAPGETLPVLVLLDGKPLADAGIENSNLVDKLPEERITRYRSNAEGIAQVVLRPHGVNMLAVDVERPNDAAFPGGSRAAPADKIMLVATYTFVR